MELTKLNLELADPSFRISITLNPVEALELIKHLHFDCIVSDYLMNDMSGIQLCAEVKKIDDTPFIIYTGRGSEEVASTAFYAGVDDYVRKEPTLAHYKVLARRIRHAVERRGAEERLSNALQRLEAQINNSPLAVIEFDPEFRVTRWSDEAERMFGWSASEILGKSIVEMHWVYEDDAELVQKESAALFSGTKHKGLNVNRNYRRDGSVIWCEWYSSAIYDSSGKLVSLLSQVLDVTERRRRREERTRLASFPQLNPSPVLEADESGKILFMNAATITALPEVSRAGNVSSFELNWGDVVSRLRSGTGAPLFRDVEVNGVWYSLSLHMVPDSGNVRIYATNIDDRKRGEEELRASYERLRKSEAELAASNEELQATEEELRVSNEQLEEYNIQLERTVEQRTRDLKEAKDRVEASQFYIRNLIEVSLDPLVTISTEGKITDVNEATVQATGVPRNQLIGTEFSSYFTEPEKAKEGGIRAFKEGYIRDYPLAIRHTSGRIMEVLYNATVYRDPYGEVAGVFAAARDVTERKLLEKKLHRSEVIAAVEQMGATVAHDLRGPLGQVVQAVNMIKRDPSLTPRMLQIVEENAVRSLKMIADWRSSTREIVPHSVETDLVKLVKSVLDGSAIPERVKIVTSFGDGLGSINVDGDIMNRVLDNLVRNAVEAMPDGGRLVISVVREVDELVIKVGDTGVGIPEESRERIFSPLYTTKAGGMGLGLTYCRRAVEAMGGSIEFTSNVGVGTVFSVKLPIHS